MARNEKTYSKDNPSPDGPWRFQKGVPIPRWTCPVCELDTTISRKNNHKCSGPKFDHPDYEDIRLYRMRLYHRAKYRGDECTLTAQQIAQLLEEAGITIHQLGSRAHQYHLARYGDTGNYEWGNCRFLLSVENIKEQKSTCMKPVVVGDVVYPSRTAAARAIGVAGSTIRDRIKSKLPRWANYNWKEE